MNAVQVQNVHRTRPFRPFTILTASGESYPVSHPEALWQSPGGRTIVVGIKGERVAMIDIKQIAEFVYTHKRPAKGAK